MDACRGPVDWDPEDPTGSWDRDSNLRMWGSDIWAPQTWHGPLPLRNGCWAGRLMLRKVVPGHPSRTNLQAPI